MSFTRSTTNTSVHQGMPDYPSSQGYTSTQLKQAFDAPAEGLQTDVNGLMTELEDTTAAANIGADAIDAQDTSNGTVQDKLDYLQSELQGIALGGIPDGTITQAKLNSTYEGTIAKKDGTLQTGLSSEMLNGKTEAQLKSAFLSTPNPTTLSFAKLDAPSSTYTSNTVTETKTLNTNGSRYFLVLSSYTYGKLMMYDAQTQKFIFADPYKSGNNPYNVTSENLYYDSLASGSATVDISASYSSNVVTFNVTKKSYHGSSDNKLNVPAGTITVFELGGIV